MKSPELTVPSRDLGTVRFLRDQYARWLLSRFAQLDEVTGDLSRPYEELVVALGEAFESRPARVLDVVLRPSLSTLVNCAIRAKDPALRDARLRELIPLTAFELGLDGLLGRRVIGWGSHVPVLFSVTHDVKLDFAKRTRLEGFEGRHVILDPGPPLTLDAGALAKLRSTRTRRFRGSARFPRVRGPIALALFDNNPLAHLERHPDKSGSTLDLGGRAPRAWVSAMGRALDLVAAGLPRVRREMDVLLAQIVPVGFFDERHESASYLENVGTAYLSLHPSALTLAEALVHEFQHNKLNALHNLDPILDNGYTSLHRSPVRPDDRPLMGVLLAVHALLPVAEMYLGLRAARHAVSRTPTFDDRLRAIVAGNAEGLGVVRSEGRPTTWGARLVDELTRLQASHEAALGSPPR